MRISRSNAVTRSPDDFSEFMERRVRASDAFVNGEFDPLDRISVQDSPASLFGPRGDVVHGADQVNAANAKGAGRFRPGSTNALEVLHQGAGETFAYWVGIQRSHVRMEGKEEAVPFDLRVTELFRREDGQWKLFHRHADPLKSGD